MHFVINKTNYFDLEIGEQCITPTPDKFYDYKNVIEITYDFNLDDYGWGAGGGWYIRRNDIKNIADALAKLYNGSISKFDYHCKQVNYDCYYNEYFYLELTKASGNTFHSRFNIVNDLETVYLEADFRLEALKKDAELWQEYAEKYPVI